MAQEISFPRQFSRTQRFSLGAPRSFAVSPDGRRVAFLRSRGGTERANLLFVLDLSNEAAPFERVAADPVALLGGGEEHLSAEERARRERAREGSAGVVGYATDAALTMAVFSLSGRLFTAPLTGGDGSQAGQVAELPVQGTVLDPRPAPDGRHIAYATTDGALRVIAADGSGDRLLAHEGDDPEVTWGQAEFVAQEEMDRSRGFWWSPQGDRLLAARVDNRPVQRWWIADPANPDHEPVQVAYPRAGTPNAEVSLAVVDLDGRRVDVGWDRAAYPYLARVHWSAGGPPLLLVQSRDQRRQVVLTVDPDSGETVPLLEESDPDWLELCSGVPVWTPGGRLVRVADDRAADARVLVVGDRVVTDGSLHVRQVLDVTDEDVLFTASAGEGATDPEIGEVHVYRVDTRVGAGTVHRISDAPGYHSAVRGGPVTVLSSAALDRPGALVRVLRTGADTGPDSGNGDGSAVRGGATRGGGSAEVARVASRAETPGLTARPALTLAGERRIPAAVLLPTGYDRERDGLLPVLMAPYGGPHGQQVVAAQNIFLSAQWFADQGFAVVVADGRGTPGRSPSWEKAIMRDMAAVTLDDQVEALRALAADFPLDLGRVGIRGWSYGGYLAALAVLRRPDVFHAAVAGAPVTDMELYDTHYAERYLGHPAEEPQVYAAHSLLADAPKLRRPLQIIHGLADDNVVVAHSLRLSAALLAAGRPHEVLPLAGVTHMTPQEEVAENLLLLQVEFLRRALPQA
ncbi:prolyl oligopeptidase family serine peptidase [Streptacidiphilus anmyonensis]|uniref:prolyl oligopeptidase family serine peptidase n=1 Tax=Streptacidiphilus anmyonensis TaxID=405782 RepID=UPI0005A97905|nr:prolyl oligopeptidase family serine peptidase [Streptacidiphilus anmyonensis]